jgi:hypothetical protein
VEVDEVAALAWVRDALGHQPMVAKRIAVRWRPLPPHAQRITHQSDHRGGNAPDEEEIQRQASNWGEDRLADDRFHDRDRDVAHQRDGDNAHGRIREDADDVHPCCPPDIIGLVRLSPMWCSRRAHDSLLHYVA